MPLPPPATQPREIFRSSSGRLPVSRPRIAIQSVAQHQADSIDTRNTDRDNHLRSNDFLAMKEHPEITFRSTEVEKLDQDHYRVTGDLTIRGITKSVPVDFEFTGIVVDPYGNQRVGFEGNATINRKDFGVSWNVALDGGGVMVSDKINLEFEVEAIKVVA